MNFIKKHQGPILLLIGALIWGTTFVAQSLGSDKVGPFTFNAIRFTISGVILLIVGILIKDPKPTNKKYYIYAVLTGIALFLAATLQQVGIDMTKSAAKSGFLTSLYIVFVPIIGLLFKNKTNKLIWVWIIIALIGSYLIALKESFTFELGDILTIICSFFFALQILLIDKSVKYISSIKICSIQFLVTGLLSFLLCFILEDVIMNNVMQALPAILYAAILSGCIAYLLQIIGQKTTEPTIASLIMSLEAVFALLAGILILKEQFNIKEILGCILVFTAVICSQINFKRGKL